MDITYEKVLQGILERPVDRIEVAEDGSIAILQFQKSFTFALNFINIKSVVCCSQEILKLSPTYIFGDLGINILEFF